MRRAAIGLFFLSPLIAEYLLGNVPFDQLPWIVFLAPMYGGGAVLIREFARRTGRGWRAMIPLAAGYGLLEAGILDQSLFNPSYEGFDFQYPAHVPVLGISAYHAVTFIAGHVIWSISVPIALAEAVSRHPTRPWLGRRGIAVAAGVFVLGDLVIFVGHVDETGFMARPQQLVGVAVVVAILVTVACRRWAPATPAGTPAPNPTWLAAGALAVTSGAFLMPEGWPGFGLIVGLYGGALLAIRAGTRRAGWGAPHRLALAGGALLSYCWVGFFLLVTTGSASTLNLAGQGVLVGAALVLLTVAVRRTSPRTAEMVDRAVVGVAIPAAAVAIGSVVPVAARWLLGLHLPMPFRLPIRFVAAVDRPVEVAINLAIWLAMGIAVATTALGRQDLPGQTAQEPAPTADRSERE